MNVNFKLAGIKVSLPAQQINVEVEEISYGVENANVIEIAQASKQIMSSVLEVYREMEGSAVQGPDFGDFSFDDINSGDEGLYDEDERIVLEPGDYVREGNFAGTIVEVDGMNRAVRFIIQETTEDTSFIGKSQWANVENVNYVTEGHVTKLAEVASKDEDIAPFSPSKDEVMVQGIPAEDWRNF